jgi:hypothetical protein
MTPDQNPMIHLLDGYLNCLATICGSKYFFSATSFQDSRDIDVFVTEIVKNWALGDEYIKASEYEYKGRKVIEFKHLRKQVGSFVFSEAMKPHFAEKEGYGTIGGKILWDIFEYYGLASTHINESGDFHPLVKGPVYQLYINHKTHQRSLYYLARIEGIYVLTAFIEKE